MNVVGFAYIDGDGGRISQADVFKRRGNNRVIIEADIRLDYYEDFDTHAEFDTPRLRSQIGFCIRDTLTHEFGHWVQLNDVRLHSRCGLGHICSRYVPYTMQNCFSEDQHHRETLYDADKHSAWYTYNRSNRAPQGIYIEAQRATSILQTRLLNNYPDPFNPETWIPYELAEDSSVTITIYDSTGNHVRHLDLGHHTRGRYFTKTKAAHWDGKDDYGQVVTSGLYFYTLAANGISDTQRLVVIK